MTQSDKKEKDKEMRKAESVPEKGKQLSRKAADKLKFYGVAAVLSLLCAGFIWFIFKPDTTETVEGTAGINTTIPDAIAPETMTDKQKAYELERMKKRRQEGLFVPNTAERTAMKEAAANIGGSFGTSISFARSASQQLVMDVTRGVLGGGSQYLATKMREVKVVVKANYQLLLISKKQ